MAIDSAHSMVLKGGCPSVIIVMCDKTGSRIPVDGVVSDIIKLITEHAIDVNQRQTGKVELHFGTARIELTKTQSISVRRAARAP